MYEPELMKNLTPEDLSVLFRNLSKALLEVQIYLKDVSELALIRAREKE